MDPQQNQTPIQNPITTPIIPTEQIKPPHSHKILWILLSVFILLSVAGLFVFKNQIKETSEVSLVQNIATTTDEFAGWKTYRNEDLGVELKYPANYGDLVTHYKEKEMSDFVTGHQVYSIFPDYKYFSIVATSIDYTYPSEEMNFNKYITENGKYYLIYNGTAKYEVKPIKILHIDDHDLFVASNYMDPKYKDCEAFCFEVSEGTVFINTPNNKIYSGIEIFFNNTQVTEEEKSKILSTFKFVNNYGASESEIESEIRNIVEKSIIKDERSNLDKIKLISAKVENENNNLITIKLNFNRDFFVDPTYNGYEGNPYETTLGFIIEGLKPVFKTLYQKTSRQPALDLLENGKERDGMLIDIRFLE